MVQELLDVLQVDEVQEADDNTDEPVAEQLFLSLSVVALSGNSVPHTMCFWGQLGHQPVRILLDSGRSHTFISNSIAAQCSSVQQLNPPLRVQVANGQVLTCSSHIPTAE